MTTSTTDYIHSLPEDRQKPFKRLLQTIRKNISPGFKEVMASSPAFVVPLSIFPAGYHCTPNSPLPFLNLVSQKNSISLHNFGLYMNAELTQWFIDEYSRLVPSKIDMGKSCIRFKKMDQIPYELIGQLLSKQPMDEFIACYETAMNRNK
jgi:hypothetical protein